MIRAPRLLFPAVALVALGLASTPAHAGPLVSSAPSCDSPALSQPFTPWLDPAHYVLAPGGTFEVGEAGWSGTGAGGADENEPYYVHGAGEVRSLAVGPTGSATSPTMCVGLEHPTLRFFARRTGGDAASVLRVEVLFEDAGGSVHAVTVGAVGGDGSWQPTSQMPVVANLLPLLPDDHTPVAFRLVSEGGGSWLVDDFYVDPYRRT